MEIQEFVNGAERLRDGLLKQAMHYLGNGSDAEDAVQETLLKLWIARERIDDDTKMLHMASVVCRNVSLNMLRDARQNVRVETLDNMANADSPQRQLEIHENQLIVKQSIRLLSDKYRAIIRMRNVENMPYADIARILGTTESSVRGMISKARMELLKNIKKAKQ